MTYVALGAMYPEGTDMANRVSLRDHRCSRWFRPTCFLLRECFYNNQCLGFVSGPGMPWLFRLYHFPLTVQAATWTDRSLRPDTEVDKELITQYF